MWLKMLLRFEINARLLTPAQVANCVAQGAKLAGEGQAMRDQGVVINNKAGFVQQQCKRCANQGSGSVPESCAENFR